MYMLAYDPKIYIYKIKKNPKKKKWYPNTKYLKFQKIDILNF